MIEKEDMHPIQSDRKLRMLNLRFVITYLVAPFAFAIELPILAQFCAELVYVRCGGSELIVNGQGIQTTIHER